MRKSLFYLILTLSLVLIGCSSEQAPADDPVDAQEVSEAPNTSAEAQEEQEKESIRDGAIEADFIEINGDRVDEGTKLTLTATVDTIDGTEMFDKMLVVQQESDGVSVYIIEDFSGKLGSLSEGDSVTIWGLYNGKDENTSIPVIGAFEYEIIPASEPTQGSQTHKILRVVDGDTIIVDYNRVETRVRLIGIDTPESVHPDDSKNTEEGIVASQYTKNLLEGKEVSLELDVQETDKYGRLLAYVWLGDQMVNKILLQDGMAQVSTYPPNVKYVDDFTEIQRVAREQGVGLWGEVSTVQEPVTQQYQGAFIIDKSSSIVGPIGDPDNCAVIGSLKSDKYHIPGYTHSGQIAEHNLIYFESIEHAVSNGYKPCGICY